MALGIDDEIIDWSLKMVHDNPVHPVSFIADREAMIIACFGTRHVNRDEFEHAKRRHKKNRNRMVSYGLMLYALKRTGYKASTGDRGIDDLDHTISSNRRYGAFSPYPGLAIDYTYPAFTYWWSTYELSRLIYRYEGAIKPLISLVIALTKGGDFPQDCTDMPLEFLIEAVKASVPEQES